MDITQFRCPYCSSINKTIESTYNTKNNGQRLIYLCLDCKKSFSETKGTIIEGLVKPVSFIAQVLDARSEGMAFNATIRTFKIAKNTLLEWERKFASLKQTFVIYAMLHSFLIQLIEGDELYTKVKKNVPVEDCEGWTIVLMDRASRFIWKLECGKKDHDMFLSAIQTLVDVVERTKDTTLVTDGERRYGKILFQICNEIVYSGKPGRPPKVLKKGVKVRLKNKGENSKNNKGKKDKYESPQREHPGTPQNISEHEIHANHAEAFNSSTRRRNSAFRRKTNTYSKKKNALQRTLDILWIVHNFIRIHFTTKKVPAVAIGIMKKGLSWVDMFKVQRIPSAL